MVSDRAVVVDGISHSFGAVKALADISFSTTKGELFGLIGPDGAGKTTLLRILTTLIVPDAGTALLLGHDTVRDYRALRQRLGYMPGRFALYPDLSAQENLAFYASVFGTTIARGMRIIAPIWQQLAPFADRRAGALSGGMKQKLALCCALVHAPDLLVLDEPTTGVDAVSRNEFWDLLARLRSDGLSIMVSTPYMDEASRCDRIALMQAGRMLRIDTPAAIAASYPRPLFAVRGANRLGLLSALRAYPHASSAWPFGEVLHYTDQRVGDDPLRIADELTRHLRDLGNTDAMLTPIPATIEDVFMALEHDDASPVEYAA
jgi:ABC-type multidrug transport system ATPase subunit